MKRNDDDEQEPPLARWKDIAQAAGISTKTGRYRFLVTVKLPERSLKTASQFVKETNEALRGKKTTAQFVLVDSERVRLQRATAEFCKFKDARTFLSTLKELGLAANDVSPELEDFGKKQYDPWYEKISQSWWPWLAAMRNPAPEMPMMKPKIRLDVSTGSKYSQGASGKLGKGDEAERREANEDRGREPAEEQEDRADQESPENEDRGEARNAVRKRKRTRSRRNDTSLMRERRFWVVLRSRVRLVCLRRWRDEGVQIDVGLGSAILRCGLAGRGRLFQHPCFQGRFSHAGVGRQGREDLRFENEMAHANLIVVVQFRRLGQRVGH